MARIQATVRYPRGARHAPLIQTLPYKPTICTPCGDSRLVSLSQPQVPLVNWVTTPHGTFSPSAMRNPSLMGGHGRRECSEDPVTFPTGSTLHHGRSTRLQATHAACTLLTAGSSCAVIQHPGKASLTCRGPRAHTAPGHATGTGAAPLRPPKAPVVPLSAVGLLQAPQGLVR
ncbi:hypothetical protein NDU88_009736 [Pleurodeles waltl]|uniref:Uncharacterized protein n=1 Tax=Pleurodeles waltl TaxID=8319 RepID=A0AAV7PU23_PLEWA|nr:hypothetical protein NDU88_009736 [Pleurodeles waltl]